VPTHRAGGTLHLVITRSDQLIDNLTVQPPDILSDHSLLSWEYHWTCCLQLPLTERSGGGRSWMVTSFALHFWSLSCVILQYAHSLLMTFSSSIMTFCKAWLIILHQSRRSPYDASDSQPGWMLSVDSFDGSLVCLKGVTVVHSNHLIDSSGLSTSERDIKYTGKRNNYTGLRSCLNTPVNRGSCGDH